MPVNLSFSFPLTHHIPFKIVFLSNGILISDYPLFATIQLAIFVSSVVKISSYCAATPSRGAANC